MSMTAAVLQAGAAKVDITDERGLVIDCTPARWRYAAGKPQRCW